MQVVELESNKETNNQIRKRTKAGKVEQEERVKQTAYLKLQYSEIFSVSLLFHAVSSPRISVFHRCRDASSGKHICITVYPTFFQPSFFLTHFTPPSTTVH